MSVAWLLKLSHKLHLLPSVNFVAVGLFDRFLSKESVLKKDLYKLILACCSLAFKFEMSVYPPLKDVVRQSKLRTTAAEVAEKEKDVWRVLDFNIIFPTPLSFISYCSRGDGNCSITRLAARYILEECLSDSFYLRFLPSALANFAFYLSLKVLHRGGWSPAMESASICDRRTVSEYVLEIMPYFATHLQRGSTYDKYSTQEFFHVSVRVFRYIATYCQKFTISPQLSSSSSSCQISNNSPTNQASMNYIESDSPYPKPKRPKYTR